MDLSSYSFIQKLSKKETEASQETTATIGNLKRRPVDTIDSSYFGYMFANKNNGIMSKSKIKRIKGISQVINSKQLNSPTRGLNLVKSMETSHGFSGGSIGMASQNYNTESLEYTPNLFKEESGG